MGRPQAAKYPSLSGLSVFVTGGASGIGEAVVRDFAAQGAKVAFVDIEAERGAALVVDVADPDFDVTFDRALWRLLRDRDLRRQLAGRSAEICDGLGAGRAAEVFLTLIAGRLP